LIETTASGSIEAGKRMPRLSFMTRTASIRDAALASRAVIA
jgi:hypothetical protein